MLPVYRYDVADIPEKREEYINLFNAFVSSCNISPSDSDYERVLAVHDNMCASFCYDTTLKIDCTYELLAQGKGVCEALAILYEAVLTHLGIECDTVINRAEAHCWNVVKLDGEWYHLDVTWADPITYGGGINNHDYFLLNDTELAALNARDKELDMLFERLYEDNVSGKIDDARFSKMSKRYEEEQGEIQKKLKLLKMKKR